MLDPQKTIEELRKKYAEMGSTNKMHALLLAEKGGGKTTAIGTAPKPILLASFDPGGPVVLKDLIDKGDVVVVSYEADEITHPTAFSRFNRDFNEWRRNNFFENFKTFAIDSATTMVTCLIWQIMNKEGRIPANIDSKTTEGQGMRIQDWGTLANTMQMLARMIQNLPCHTILTGHVERERDEVTGGFVRTILLPGQSQRMVPVTIPELFVIKKVYGPGGTKRVLLTDDDGEYRASTRIGGQGKLQREEKPDLSEILKKCGVEV